MKKNILTYGFNAVILLLANCEGPEGIPGPQGDQGPAGDQGELGPAGPRASRSIRQFQCCFI